MRKSNPESGAASVGDWSLSPQNTRMAGNRPNRLHVVDADDGSEVPFLRGILTRSLQKAGMAFDDAYSLASELRDELADEPDISSDVLREKVARKLKKGGFNEIRKRYQLENRADSLISVISRDESSSPFSKGLLVDSMEICGMGRDESYGIVTRLEQNLLKRENRQVSSEELKKLTACTIEEVEGKAVAERYRRWIEFSHSGRPLILLVGGTTGSGKSTISSELAHRLNIVRTQSTDMLREVMRLMIPERLIPTLHMSSFEAFRAMPRFSESSGEPETAAMIEGYLNQASQVAVGIEGVLSRAENERISLIIEGVHVHPALQSQIMQTTEAIVVPMIVAVLGKKRLKKQLVGRGQQVTSRRSERYVENFDRIWKLQSFLLSEADRHNIPIVQNEDEDEMLRFIMQLVSEHLAREKAA